jgi:hypothetical protein
MYNFVDVQKERVFCWRRQYWLPSGGTFKEIPKDFPEGGGVLE